MINFDTGAFASQLRSAAESLRVTSDEVQRTVQEAQAKVVQVGDDDGLAEVEVDGRPRVRAIRLSQAALDDTGRLDRLLTELTNRALTQARASTQEAVTGVLPPTVRAEAAKSEEDR